MANGSVWTNDGRKIYMERNWVASPTRSAISKFRVGTGTTTPAKTDTALTTPIGSETTLNSATVDDSNRNVILDGQIDQSTLNGNTITEMCFDNTDGTPLLLNHTVYNSVAKNAQIILDNQGTFGVREK